MSRNREHGNFIDEYGGGNKTLPIDNPNTGEPFYDEGVSPVVEEGVVLPDPEENFEFKSSDLNLKYKNLYQLVAVLLIYKVFIK